MKGERREIVGEEMMLVLSVLGQILFEVADAQVSMCQSLEALLSLLLEAFEGVGLNKAARLRSKSDVISENAESLFGRYMHGRHAERANMSGEGVGGDCVKGMGGGATTSSRSASPRPMPSSSGSSSSVASTPSRSIATLILVSPPWPASRPEGLLPPLLRHDQRHHPQAHAAGSKGCIGFLPAVSFWE